VKRIILTLHAMKRARLRGATEAEVSEVVNDGDREPAKWGKFSTRKRFAAPTRSRKDGMLYNDKTVEIILADEPDRRDNGKGVLLRPRRTGMKVKYDAEADAVYIEFRKAAGGAVETRQLTDEIIVDYGRDGKLVGIEILNASIVLGEEPGRVIVDVATAKARAGSR